MTDWTAAWPPVSAAATRRFLTFRVDGPALRAAGRAGRRGHPRAAPSRACRRRRKGLLGLANLRGSVLPVASLRGLLGRTRERHRPSRAIVLDGAAPVALAVDAVEALVSVDARPDRDAAGRARGQAAARS